MKINTYQFIRKLHLYIAFSIMSFVFMYFVSGFILIHESWFLKSKPKTETFEEVVQIPVNSSIDEASNYVEKKLDIHAKPERAEKNNDESLYFEYSKPGGTLTVTILSGGAKAIVKATQFTAAGTMVGFHRVHGYGGGWIYNLYVLMMDLASIATILFGFTGLYLWYRLMRKNRKWGVVIISASLAYTIIVISFFMNG